MTVEFLVLREHGHRAGRCAGNNGPVSTARASSFLKCPGGAVARGWSLAWPERVVGVAGPLADLAALVSACDEDRCRILNVGRRPARVESAGCRALKRTVPAPSASAKRSRPRLILIESRSPY